MKLKSIHAAPALLIFVFALYCASSLLSGAFTEQGENPYLAVIIIQLLVFAVPTVFYCRLRLKSLSGRLRLRLFGLRHVMIIVFGVMLLIFGNAFLSITMYSIFPDAYTETVIKSAVSANPIDSGLSTIYSLIAFAVLPAVTEELLFRSVIVAEYESSGIVTAVIFSALTFAMVHFSFIQFPMYFFTGAVLAIILYATRSVFASMAAHITYNTIILFFEEYLNRLFINRATSITLLMIIVFALTLLSAIFLFGEADALYRIYSNTNYPTDYTAKRKKGPFPRFVEAFLAPAFIMLTVFFIIVAAVS